ncbi:hypothetical protein DTQ70_17685 [Runella sp. SP2]|nr:hypothetical protein DTQ70_17685 [Runella sp. SP2]
MEEKSSIVRRCKSNELSKKIIRSFLARFVQFNRYLSRFFQKQNYKGGQNAFTYSLRTHYAIYL